MTNRLPQTLLCLILTLKALFIVWFIAQGIVHLGPDEAQYWTWSRDLDLGYYSKPPGIAWQIWLGCLAFGQTETGVRIGSVLISILLTIGVYNLSKSCSLTPIASTWAAVIMALAPIGILSSLFAITDGGMVLFWTLAMIVCVRSDKPNDLLLGCLIACGALFKWPIYFFWIIRIIWGCFKRPLLSLRLLVGFLISLLGLIPSVVWNFNHEWVTFKHVFYTLYAEKGAHIEHPGLGSGNPLDFLGAQAALISPIFFILLLLSIKTLLEQKKDIPFPVWFCGLNSLGMIGFACALACLKKLQGNWIEFAYPSAIVWIAWYTFAKYKRPHVLLLAGSAIALLLCVSTLFLPVIQSKALVTEFPIPYRVNPFRHNLGWEKLTPALLNAGYNPNKDFLFGDKYQTVSLLSFYGPDQKRAYFFNLQGTRLNQFSFWPGMQEEQKGKTGFFILADNLPKGKTSHEEKALEYLGLLKPYFDEVLIKGPYPLFKSYGTTVKEAWIYECIGYKGNEPTWPAQY